jgi:hypothetical protein
MTPAEADVGFHQLAAKEFRGPANGVRSGPLKPRNGSLPQPRSRPIELHETSTGCPSSQPDIGKFAFRDFPTH